MANDVYYIMVLFVFWVIYTSSMTAWASDPVIGVELNSSMNRTVDTSYFNSSISMTEAESNPIKYIRTFFQLVTFTIPNIGIGLNIVIGGINLILVAFGALLIYRLARSGAG